MQGFVWQATSVNLFEILTNLINQFVAIVPNVLGALAIMVAGFIIARLLHKLIRRLLEKSGVDRLMDKLNEIDFIANSRFDFKISGIIAKILYYVILIFFLMAGTEVLGMPAVSMLIIDIINYIPHLITAGIVLVIGTIFANFIKGLVKTSTASLGIPSGNFIANFVFYFLFIAVVMSALGQAKINTDFLKDNLTVIVGGAVLAFSLGYGFASRDMMANFIASFYSKSKVRIGDEVRIGDVKGTIMGMDNTSLVIDNGETKVIVPLSKLTAENIEIIREAPVDGYLD